MQRETFRYEPATYAQEMMQKAKRLRDEDVEAFVRHWLAGKDVTWICSQFRTVTGGAVHWHLAYSHARRMVRQGIMPVEAGAGPIRRYGANGERLAATLGDPGRMMRRASPGRPRGAGTARWGLPDQSGVEQRPGVPWEVQRQERIARERAEAEGRQDTQEPAETLTPGEKGAAREAAARAHKRRAKASKDTP